MTRMEAYEKARKLFGDQCVVGKNEQYPDAPIYVGQRWQNKYSKFGAGKTWQEAFDNVKDVLRQKGSGEFVFVGEEDKK